jgi:PKD repeat protein
MIKIYSLKLWALLVLTALSGSVFSQSQSADFFSSADFNPPNSAVQSSAAALSASDNSKILFASPTTVNGTFVFYGALTSGTKFAPTTNTPISFGTAQALSMNGTGFYTMSGITLSDKFVFKTSGINTGARMVVFKLAAAPVTILSTTQSPAPNAVCPANVVSVNAMLNSSLPPDQSVYLWYTKDNFATRTVLQMTTVDGTSFTGSIPTSATGTTVNYKVVTSGANLPISGTDIELFTINSSPLISYSIGPPPITTQPTNTATCQGKNATFNVVASGMITSYQWQEKIGAGAFTNLANGGVYSGVTTASLTLTGVPSGMSSNQYQCVVTNSCGLVNTSSFANLTVNALPSVSVIPTSPAICMGGSVNLTASGATSYSWTPTAGLNPTNTATTTASPTATTTYSVTGTNTAGCTNTVPVTVTVNPLANSTISPASPTICAGGSVNLTASTTGTPPFSYSWSPTVGIASPGAGSTSANPTSTTNYTLTTTITSTGCSSTTPVTVTVNPVPAVGVIPSIPTICVGGSITLTASGATTYSWSPATGLSSTIGSNTNASPSTTTTYTVSGTTNGCTGTANVTVTVNPNPAVSISPASVTTCQGFSNTLTASGASTYSWSPTNYLGTPSAATTTASPMTTTTYTVTGSTNGCSNTASVIININPPPGISVQPSNKTICTGNNANFTVSATGAGLTYQWQEKVGAGAFTNITDGPVYGGTITNSLTLTNPPSPLSTNQYQCVITGTCPSSLTTTPATLTIYPAFSAGSIGSTQAICYNSTPAAFTEITAAGGGSGTYTYQWMSSTDNIAFTNIAAANAMTYSSGPLTTTTYFKRQVMDGACASVTSNTITVTVYSSLSAGSIGSAQTICSGTSAATLTETVAATGGNNSYTYQWESSADNITFTPIAGATASTYSPGTLTSNTYFRRMVTSCTTMYSNIILITVNPIPSVGVSPTAATICANSPTTLTASGATSYTWTPTGGLSAPNAATTTANPAVTTTYTVSGLANGCSGNATVTVTVNTNPIITITPASSTICSGGSVSLSASGASSYSWSPGTGLSTITSPSTLASPTTTTTYTVTGSTGTCSGSSTVVVTVKSLPTITSQPVNASVCSNGTASFNVTASGSGITYQWQEKVGPLDFTNIVDNSTFTGTATSSLTINMATSSMSTNQYQCVLSGTCPGVTSTAATLTVSQPLNAGTIGNAQTICYNTSPAALSEITIPSGGMGANTFQWQSSSDNKTFVSIPGATNTTYSPPALMASTYYLRSVTNTCGSANSPSILITVPTALIVSTTQINPKCNGSATGSASATVSGGSTPYTYSWNTSPIQNTATANGLSAGSYTVTVTDFNACVTSTVVPITAPAILTSTVSSINPSCNGGTNGSATATVTGGTTPYTFSWNTSPVQTSSNATNLIEGTYTVTVTDNNNCSTTATATIIAPPVLAATATATNVSCSGNANGTATSSVSGGITPYSYSWNTSPVQTTSNATALGTGNYTVTVTDANNCKTMATATVSSPATLVSTATATNVSCSGAANGSATASVSGGTTPYTFLWNTSPVQTTSTATALGAGNYSVTVTDANKCTTTASATVSAPATFVATATTTNVSCSGSANGTATASVSGGTTPYTFIWNTTPAQTTANATALGAGTYNVTVTDANKCTTTATAIISAPATFVATATATNVSCSGNANGTATASVSGGTTPYTFLWNTSPVQTTSTATALGAGNYSVTVTDANKCTTTATATVSAPTTLVATATSTNASCAGASNGSATASVSGGSSPYSYLWNTSPVQTTSTAAALGAGTYSVTVTDANKCTTTATATVSAPATFVATATATNVSCPGSANGTATASVNGGTTPYTFLWNTSPIQTTSNATSLGAGTYSVTVTDANKCKIAVTVNIAAPAALVATATSTNVNCTGAINGTASATVSGGTTPYSYSWNTSPVQTASNATGLGAGNYMVTVTDANKCTTSASTTVSAPATIVASATSTNVSCYGGTNGSTNVTVSGGTAPYSYSWNTTPIQTTPNATGLGTGSYIVNITDANNCTTKTTATIYGPAALGATAAATNITCSGGTTGSATTSVSGGTAPYTYSWNTSPVQLAATATGLAIGTYTVNVTDANNCTTSATTTVSGPAPLSNSTSTSNITCFGYNNGSATITTSGGKAPYTYSWNTNPAQTGTTATGLSAGKYVASVVDASGCSATAVVSIVSPAALSASIRTTNVTCNGLKDGTALIAVTGGTPPYIYSLNTAPAVNSGSFSNLAPGAYSAVVTDAKTCSTSTVAATLTEPSAVMASIAANGPSTFCQGSKIILTAGGGTKYLWSTNETTNSIVVSASGNYFVKAMDAQGCSNTSTSISVIAKAPPVADYTFSNTPTNTTVSFSALNTAKGYKYYWDFGDNSYDTIPAPSHTYLISAGYKVNLTVMDSAIVFCQSALNKFITTGTGGCTTSANFSFTQDTVKNTLTLTDKSLGSNTNWFWDFKNGDVSSVQNPSYSFKQPGIHTVCLTVRDSVKGCQDQFCINTIRTGTIANCQAKFINFTDGVSRKIQFSGSVLNSSASKFYWSFGNDEYSSQQNPAYTYPAAGYYEVCLHTKDTVTGCFSKYCEFVHAGSGDCKAKYTALPNAANPMKINFQDASVGGATSWHWDFGDGIVSNSKSPSHVFTTAGYFDVCLTTSMATCQNTYCSSIHVGNADCKTAFNYFENPIKKSIEFKDQSWGNPISWSWQFGDGKNSSLQNPQHVYDSTGVFTVCLSTINSMGCLNHSCEDITIGKIGADCQAAFEVFEENKVAVFKNKSIGDANTWFWDFGDGNQVQTKDGLNTYTSDGYYTVSLTIYNKATGCFNTAYKKVTIGTLAATKDCEAKFSYIADSTTKTVTIKDESLGNPISWNWVFSDGQTSTLQNPIIVFKNTGFYETCLTIKSSNGSTNVSCNVIGIGQNGLSANFSTEQQGAFSFKNTTALYPVSFYGSSYGKPSKWKWAFGDNEYDSLRINVKHSYQAGSYNACLTITDPVAKLLSNYCRVVKVGTIQGIKENEASSLNMNVFPNPIISQGIVSYFIEQNAVVQLNLVDMQGRKLRTFANSLQQGQVNQLIDVSDMGLSQGMYLMHLTVNGKIFIKPVIINK